MVLIGLPDGPRGRPGVGGAVASGSVTAGAPLSGSPAARSAEELAAGWARATNGKAPPMAVMAARLEQASEAINLRWVIPGCSLRKVARTLSRLAPS